MTAADSSPPGSNPPTDASPPVDGSGTARARCVLAPNPGPMTLNGTNTWLIAEPGSAVAMVVDPGPDDEAHLGRVRDLAAAAGQRIGRILLTHGHLDHSAGAARLAALTRAPVMAVDPALRRGPDRRIRLPPGHLVGLAADVPGPLAGRDGGEEEPGVIPAGLGDRGDPARPGA